MWALKRKTFALSGTLKAGVMCGRGQRLIADTKLYVSYFVGGRDAGCADEFMQDCASRIRGRVQITTDGHRVYVDAVEGAFRDGVDYAQLQKIYGAPSDEEIRRYSPARCIGCDMKVVSGNPTPSTSAPVL